LKASANRFANSVCATASRRFGVTPRAASRRTLARKRRSARRGSITVGNQLDPSARLITGLERCHLARDVVRISPERRQAKRESAAT
jgi:hypothetical protein